jgi:hypothetical protein
LALILSPNPIKEKDGVKMVSYIFNVFLQPLPGRDMIQSNTGIPSSGLGYAG